MGLDKSRDYYAITTEMLNLFNNIRDATSNDGLGDVEELYIAAADYHMKHSMEEQITEQQVTADLLSAHGQPNVDEDISVQTVNETPLTPHCPEAEMFVADFEYEMNQHMTQKSSKQEDLADIIRGQQPVEEALCGKHGIVLAAFPDEAGTPRAACRL
jgi:hypothetical protein